MSNRQPEPSIRRQLLIWLMLPLCIVWLATTAFECFYCDWASDSIYDQEILNSADSIIARLRYQPDGTLTCNLPRAADAVLEHNGLDRFWWQVRDGKGKLLSRQAIFDHFVVPTLGRPIYYDSAINGVPVRKATFLTTLDQSNIPVFIEVAETLNARRRLENGILVNVILAQLAMIVLGGVAVRLAVARGLSPLKSLQQAISERTSSDLGPVSQSGVPIEVASLVQAINDLLGRLRLEIDSQKRFVANAAHQIRTPVAGLKTYVGLAKRLAQTPELANVLGHVDEGTDRLTHLTNRLLSLARAEPRSPQYERRLPVDLNLVASSALSELVSAAISKQIELGFEAAAAPAIVLGDAQSLQELVTNLVENAIIYTPTGGRVSVRISNGGDDINLSVEDNGPGIPLEERQQVFERFYRVLGTEHSGSGLGLAIVREIASAHDAKVSLDSATSGKGTLVTVTLPCVG